MKKNLLATFTAGGVLIMCQAGLAATTSDLNGILSSGSTMTITSIAPSSTTNSLTTTTLDPTLSDPLNGGDPLNGVDNTTDLSVDTPDDNSVVVEDVDEDSDHHHGQDVRALARHLREHRCDRDGHRDAVRELVRNASERSHNARRHRGNNFDLNSLKLTVRDFKKK